MQLVVQHRIFSPATLELACEPVCRCERDLVLDEPMVYTRGGFMQLGPHLIGHSGMGGHFLAFDRRFGLSMSFTTNAHLVDAEPRRVELVAAVYRALEQLDGKAKL